MFESSVEQSAHTLRSIFHTSVAWRVEFNSADFLYLCDKYIQKPMERHIVISTSVDLVRVAIEGVVYISSDGNYSTLIQADGGSRILTVQLGQLEALISKQLVSDGNVFIRIGKSLIINRNYIHYINIPKQQLVLSDARTFSHTVSASKDALRQLKELIEKE